jgi:hypothetical protein
MRTYVMNKLTGEIFPHISLPESITRLHVGLLLHNPIRRITDPLDVQVATPRTLEEIAYIGYISRN